MNPLLLLLSLVRATAAAGGGPRHAIALDVESGLATSAAWLPAELRRAAVELVGEVAEGSLLPGAALARMQEMAGRIASAVGANPQHAQSLATLTATADTVAALRLAGDGANELLAQISVDLATSPLAALVSEWRLAATPESPETVIVHILPEARQAVEVRPRGRSYIERRIRARYVATSVYPQLLLAASSQTPRDRAPDPRSTWHQRPLPDYDLAIYSEQERCKGSVVTRRLQGRIIARGASLTLELDAPAGHAIISTEILDETDKPLARILRWPPIAA